MHKEHAYLLIRVNDVEEAIRVLIDKCHNVSEVIEFAVKFHISDELLWNCILLKANGNNAKVNELLEFVDYYSHP